MTEFDKVHYFVVVVKTYASRRLKVHYLVVVETYASRRLEPPTNEVHVKVRKIVRDEDGRKKNATSTGPGKMGTYPLWYIFCENVSHMYAPTST